MSWPCDRGHVVYPLWTHSPIYEVKIIPTSVDSSKDLKRECLQSRKHNAQHMEVDYKHTFVLQFPAFLIGSFPKTSCWYMVFRRRMDFPLLFPNHTIEKDTQRDREMGPMQWDINSWGIWIREMLEFFVLDLQVFCLSIKSFQNKLFSGKIKPIPLHVFLLF